MRYFRICLRNGEMFIRKLWQEKYQVRRTIRMKSQMELWNGHDGNAVPGMKWMVRLAALLFTPR